MYENVKFVKRVPEKESEMALTSGIYAQGETPYLGIVYFEDGYPDIYGDLTENIPGLALKENEVAVNHDLVGGETNRNVVNAALDYIAVPDSVREVTFGPYKTKTIVFKLKDGWADLCIEEE